MRQIIKILDIPYHIKTTAYNPQSNGFVETHNRVLKDQLVAYVNQFQTNWDEFLGIIAGAYRMTINEATGYSPFYLLYGREPAMPSAESLESQLNDTELTLQDYVRGFAQVMRTVPDDVSWKFIRNVD